MTLTNKHNELLILFDTIDNTPSQGGSMPAEIVNAEKEMAKSACLTAFFRRLKSTNKDQDKTLATQRVIEQARRLTMDQVNRTHKFFKSK